MTRFRRTARTAMIGAAVAVAVYGGQTAVASAAPDLTPLTTTTCSYTQVQAALDAQAPDLARQLAQYPMAQARLQTFLSAPVDQREQMLDQAQGLLAPKAGTEQSQQYADTVLQVAETCGQY